MFVPSSLEVMAGVSFRTCGPSLIVRKNEMAQTPVSDQTAKLLREAWFSYLDTILPIRPSLYRYCRRVTRDLWDAEDLLQETLLRGFGAIGRGDLCRQESRVKDPRTYLFRIATNLWIDQVRRSELRSTSEPALPESAPNASSLATREAVSVLLTSASPQERAALVLKDVFDFTLEEIAVILATTVGAVKSALHRGRAGLEQKPHVRAAGYRAPSKELLERFCAAFNARDVQAVVGLLLDSTTYDVPGVGGERGKNTIWVNVRPPDDVTAEPMFYNGEWVMVFWRGYPANRVLAGVDRLEEEEARIARIITYHYCPDTIRDFAAELGVRAQPQGESEGGYHQDSAVLLRMIDQAVLPWASA
jgi:RNA polymerase sigma-70 factor (ECF subfamily)